MFDNDDLFDQTTLNNPNFPSFSNNFQSAQINPQMNFNPLFSSLFLQKLSKHKNKKLKKETKLNQKPRIFSFLTRIQKTMMTL